MNNEISNEDLLSNVRARLGVDKGGLKYPTYVAPPSFKPGTNDLDDKSALTRRARFIASGEMLFKTDLSTLDDTGASALYEVVTEGMFGLKDSDGQMAFGKRAKKNPRENLEMLRRFVKGEYNLIEDPEYTKWREMDEEGKFRYALENESKDNKVKSYLKGERGASPLEVMFYGMAANPPTSVPGMVRMFRPQEVNEAMDKQYADSARRLHYDALNDEEKAAYRADVIGDYEKKLSRRQTLATYLQFASNLSDKAAYLLAESFQKGTPDINVEFLDPEERDRVYSAFSLMRGDQKRGRILGFFETDFTDDTAANRLQLGLYGLQQSLVGLVTDTGDMMRAGALRAYAQVMLDDAERKAFFEGWDATVRAERAMEQPLPEASSGWGDAFQGLMENVHWFIPYGVIGKGGKIAAGATKTVNKAKLTTETLKGMRTASEIKAAAAKTRWLDEFQGAVNAGRKIDDLSSVIAWKNQVAAIEKYTKALQNVAKVEKSAKMARIGGRSLWTVGEASALSAFSSEYLAAADAAGISREESVITAFAIGLINAQVERLYVAGLESSLTPAQVKALTFKALYNAVKSDGAAGFRKWFANRVQRGVVEGAKVTVTEGMIEEPLQQLATEHGIAFDKICQELRAEGKADIADQLGAFWQSFAKQLPKDYGVFIDTVCDTMPTSLAFGVTTVGNAMRKQHLHNAWTRHQNRRAGSTHTMLGATSPEELRTAIDYDAGLVDLIQQGINTQLAVEKHWKGDKSDEAKNPNRFAEALTAARRAYRKAQTRDIVQEVAEAAGVDVKTAEVITQYLQTEAESIAFSPQARAFSSLRMSLADIDETTIKTVLPGYIEGSYAADEENGIYSGRVKLGDGTERTIAYRIGDLSEMLREQVEENSKIDSSYGVSFDERQEELGTGITWASLSDAQRYLYALTLSNGISTGRGVFELTDAKGEKVRVNADDVIYLANGRLGDIGYGTAASMGTARHETFHSLWRFARATLDEEDVQSLAKALGVDVTANGWENKLDERMAHQLEMYASGHYVSHAVSSRFDKMLDGWAGNVIKFFGSFGPADEVRDPKTGKSFALKDFYDKVLKGELGSGKLGVEIRNIPAAPAVQPGATDVKAGTIPVEVTDEERAAQDAEMREEAAERGEDKGEGEERKGVSGQESGVSANPSKTNSAENPADASVPNQRYYIIGLPNSDIKLVGRLEVRDAHTGIITSTDADYHDRGNQNRDDKSEESRALVNKIAAHPDPLQIGTVQPIANNGIVWLLNNSNVIIGNHRVNGVRLGYEKGTAGELEKFVREDAAKRGIEIGEGVKAPLTVFILEKIDAPEGVKADVHEVVRLANESQNRGFNIREQAGNDAKILIDNNLLPRMAFRPDGRIDETKSADAIGKFRQESGAQGMVGEDGMLTEEGQTRLQNAAVAALLGGTGNNALLGRIMDNAGRLDMASQLRALMKVTPELMSLAKTKPQFDIRDALAEALTLYTEWREKDEEKRSEKGKSRHDWRELDKEGKRKRGLSWEAFMSQGDMFRTPSEEAKILGDLFAKTEQLRSFDREDVESAAGKKRVVDLIADYLTDYIENARNVNTETDDMFGSASASRAEVLAAQRAKGESGARFSIAAQREYDDVVLRFTKADGTKKPGWMKAPNGKPSKLTERQWVQVRTPSFKKWFGDWEAAAEINSFDLNAAKEKLQDLIHHQEEVLTADGMKLLFRGQAKKAWSKEAERESDNSAAHWAAVGNIDELCRRAVQLWEEKPRNGSTDIRAYVKYGTVFTFGGERYIAKITTKAYPEQESQNFYSVESVAVEKIIAHGIHKTITKGQSLDVSDEGKISNLIDSVNSVSKVVDENGEPLVVAHSTDASFTIFRDMQKNDAGWLGAGFYFFGDRSLDGQYGDNVMECFLNVRNPYYLSPSEHVELAGADSAAHSREFSENLRADGYDGVYFNGDGNSEYAVFSPNQIKSATDNTGAFDGTNADIRFSIVTPAEDAAYMEAVERGDMETARKLLKVAWKRNGYSQSRDHLDAHAAPSAPVEAEDFKNVEALLEAREEGWDLNLWAVAKGISGQPNDFFSEQGPRLYGYDDKAGIETQKEIAKAISMIQAGINTRIYVYRAVPNAVKSDFLQSGGEWVSPSKTYAENHGKFRFGEGEYRIIERLVSAEHLWWDGNDAREWGYDDGRQYVYANTENGSKLATVTYNSDGNVIPLSQRFNPQKNDIRFSIGGIFTGSEADYEKPSLHYVGKSNGVAFGWGLYGSSAKSDAVNFGDNIYEQTFFTNRPEGDESHLIEWDKPLSEENKNRILDGLVYQARKNEAVKNAVESTLADEARDFGLDQDEDYVPESVEGMPDDVLREAIERTIDVQTDNGRSVYTHLAALLTGKSIGEVNSFAGRLDAFKAASEFLSAECDIDGIKYPAEADGAKHGETHYVSFRDDNIRVDHKWTDGQQRFSMSAELLQTMGEKAFKSQYGIGSAARNGEGFVDLERGDTFDGIEDYLKLRVKEEVENTILGISATIGSKGNANELARHTASGEDLESHKFAAKNVLMLFKKSKTGMVHHDKKGTGKDYIRVFAPFYFNGEIYLATITLRRDKDSDKIYSIESVLTKKDAVSGVPRGKTAPFQNAASQDSGDSPRSSRRTAQEAQSPVSLEDKISYYLGNVNETEPKFVNSSEKFSQEELLRRIRADISELQGPMYSIAPDMTGGIFPEISRMSDDELVTAAVAVRMALGETGKFSDRAVKVNTVNKLIRRLHPEYKSTDVGRESMRVISDARKFAKKIREDLDRGVSDSLILEHLPQTAREQFGREMVEEARKGQRLGRFGQKVTDKLEDRQARIVEDAVRIQTGMDVSLMENLYGINLSETLMHLAENPLTEKPPQSAGAGEGETAEAVEESAGEEAEPIDVSAAVKAAVDEIVGAAKTATDTNERNRADRRAAAGRDAERSAELDGEEPGAEGGAGEGFGGEDIVAIATKKAKLDLENPRHLAEFVAELTRRYWIKEHELGQNAEVWRDLVAVQFLRKTAQGIYAKLCKDLTYSRSRETAMQHIAKFDHAATVQGLLSEMEFVGALINAQRIRDTQKALCEKLDFFLRQKFGAQGRFRPDKEEGKRNVSAEAELRARYMRHAMWLTPDAAADEARELQEKLDLLAVEFSDAGRDRDQSREFVETIRKLNVLREFGALRYKPVGEIEAAAKWWEDFERGESDDIVRAMSDRDIRTKKAAELLAKAFADPKRVTAREGATTADRLNKFLTGHFGFISIIKDCMRHATNADREAVKDIVGWLELEIQKAGDGTATEKRHHNDAFHAAVESIYAKSFNKVMKEMMVRDDRFLKFMGEVGGKRDIPTKGRAMQLLVSLLQEGRKVEVEDEENPGKTKFVYEGGYHDNIVKHKREGQAAELMKLMSPADMNMIKWLGMWYEQNRQDLSRVCHSLFGIGVYAELPNYFPVKMRLDKQGLEKGAAVGWTIFPKALTPRVKNERDFDTSADIFQMWSSRMEEGAQWKHHAQLGLEMRGIFGRAELQGAVISNHGEATNALMQGFITDVLAGKGAVDRSTGDVQYVSDKIRGWTALCALGGNVGVMFKQLTSIPAFGFEIGLVDTARHIVSAFTPEGLAAMGKIWQSEQRKTRWDVGYSEAVANALREDRPSKPINDIGGILQRAGNGSKEAIGLLKRMLQASMITNKIGDVVPALIVGQGIYRDCIAQGMSETDAMAKTWMIVERTQQSSRMENLASIQRRNVIGRMMYQFLSTQRQYLDYELRAIREVIAQPTSVKRWKKLGTTTILNHFILTTLYWGVGQLYKAMLGQEPPEDQLTDAVISCLMGPNGSLFVVGFCCNETLQRAMKGNYFGSGTTMIPMESWIKTQIGDGIGLTHAIFDREGDTWDNILDATSEWLSDFNSTFRDLRKIYRFRIKGEEQKKRK